MFKSPVSAGFRISLIPTREGGLYLVVTLDFFNRRVLFSLLPVVNES